MKNITLLPTMTQQELQIIKEQQLKTLYKKRDTFHKCPFVIYKVIKPYLQSRIIYASIWEGGGHVIIRSATPHKKIKQLNKEFVFLRERRSLERKNTNFGQKDRLHTIQGVKCSYHTNILNGGQYEAIQTFYHRRKKKSTTIFSRRAKFSPNSRSSRKKPFLHQSRSQPKQS